MTLISEKGVATWVGCWQQLLRLLHLCSFLPFTCNSPSSKSCSPSTIYYIPLPPKGTPCALSSVMLCPLLVSVTATAQPVFEHLPCTTHPVNCLIFRASQDWPSLSTSSAFNNNGWGAANLLNMKQSEMCVDGAKSREVRGLDWGGPRGCFHGSRMSHSHGKVL